VQKSKIPNPTLKQGIDPWPKITSAIFPLFFEIFFLKKICFLKILISIIILREVELRA